MKRSEFLKMLEEVLYNNTEPDIERDVRFNMNVILKEIEKHMTPYKTNMTVCVEYNNKEQLRVINDVLSKFRWEPEDEK